MSIESSEDLVLIADVANLLIEGMEPGDEGLVASIITQYKRLVDGVLVPSGIADNARELIKLLQSTWNNKDDFLKARDKLLGLSNEIITMAKTSSLGSGNNEEASSSKTVVNIGHQPEKKNNVREQISSGELIDFFNEALDCLEDAESGLVEHDGTSGTAAELKKVFRAFHNIKAVSGFVGMREISRVAHFTEALLVKVRDENRGLTIAESEACFEAISVLKRLIADVSGLTDDKDSLINEVSYESIIEILSDPEKYIKKDALTEKGRKVGELLIERGIVSVESVGKALESQSRGSRLPLGELLVEKGVLKKKDLARALRLQSEKTNAAASQNKYIDNSPTVPAHIVDLRASTKKTFLELLENAKDKKLAPALKSSFDSVLAAMNMSMTDLDRVLKNAAATAEDVALKESIPIRIEVDDVHVKVDWEIAQELLSPLIHIVRNSIAHGIEAAFERNPDADDLEGLIKIRVADKGGYILIIVEDNGVGLNFDKVMRKAEEKGVSLSKDGSVCENRMKQLFFMERVSTSEMVTELSGRGVGLDVVKEFAIEYLAAVDIGNLETGGAYVEIRTPASSVMAHGYRCKSGASNFMAPAAMVLEIMDCAEETANIKWNDIDLDVSNPGCGKRCRTAIMRRADAGIRAVAFEEISGETELFYIISPDNKNGGNDGKTRTAATKSGEIFEILDIMRLENL